MAKRNGRTCLLFNEVPTGTNYKKGKYSWVQNSTADQYIEDGYAEEYDPGKRKAEEPKKEEPKPDLPDDIPARQILIDGGVIKIAKLKELAEAGDLQTIDQVGESTENKILEYLGD